MNIKPATAGKPRQLYQTFKKLKSPNGANGNLRQKASRSRKGCPGGRKAVACEKKEREQPI
jgi:hypothetical protein